jgi:two-component system, NtrC family, sensor histidine kinase PilS
MPNSAALLAPPGGLDNWPDGSNEFERLWRGFMTARATLGLMLLLLQVGLWWLAADSKPWLIGVCGGYFVATLWVRLFALPRRLGRSFDPPWAATIGVDVLAFAVLQFLQGASINYAPLLALPALLAAVLGSLSLALGTAAAITLLLLAQSGWMAVHAPAQVAAHFAQSALTGAGCFAIALLAHQVSTRLAREEQRSLRNRLAERTQRQVNQLVIESLADGILVVDAALVIRATNPAARELLGFDRAPDRAATHLHTEPAWAALTDMAQQSFSNQAPADTDVVIRPAGAGQRRLHVRTRLTSPQGPDEQRLCVMFLQDQRESEARLRTEKLASMGRMSAAVAHEIRNPLAAITQANALLEEDITDPRQRQLTHMVAQNANRLGRIVEEVLNISRVQSRDNTATTQSVALSDSVARICREWAQHGAGQQVLRVALQMPDIRVRFEAEHLRRVLINLLDNALRFASQQPGAIQVDTTLVRNDLPQGFMQGAGCLTVWSDGQPLEQSVERHLFEPFFSSDSRSSGLGLYICRELCEGQGASLAYQRIHRQIAGQVVHGNEFSIVFQPLPAGAEGLAGAGADGVLF